MSLTGLRAATLILLGVLVTTACAPLDPDLDAPEAAAKRGTPGGDFRVCDLANYYDLQQIIEPFIANLLSATRASLDPGVEPTPEELSGAVNAIVMELRASEDMDPILQKAVAAFIDGGFAVEDPYSPADVLHHVQHPAGGDGLIGLGSGAFRLRAGDNYDVIVPYEYSLNARGPAVMLGEVLYIDFAEQRLLACPTFNTICDANVQELMAAHVRDWPDTNPSDTLLDELWKELFQHGAVPTIERTDGEVDAQLDDGGTLRLRFPTFDDGAFVSYCELDRQSDEASFFMTVEEDTPLWLGGPTSVAVECAYTSP